MSVSLLPRKTTNWTSVIFSDESSISGQKYFAFGGLYIALPSRKYKTHIQGLENKLAEIKANHGIGVAKWEKVKEHGWRLDGYKAMVEYLSSREVRKYVKFSCMVVDRSKYKLRGKRGDMLDGYLRYYCVFLTSGIMNMQEGYFYDITIDDFEFRPDTGHGKEDLERSVEYRYLNKCKDPKDHNCRHSVLDVSNDEDSNILQMADVLSGAVAYCHNGGRERPSKISASRNELVATIQRCYGGLAMNKPQRRGAFRIFIVFSSKSPKPITAIVGLDRPPRMIPIYMERDHFRNVASVTALCLARWDGVPLVSRSRAIC
jgi:Protein of unknown function (DUF3800)